MFATIWKFVKGLFKQPVSYLLLAQGGHIRLTQGGFLTK